MEVLFKLLVYLTCSACGLLAAYNLGKTMGNAEGFQEARRIYDDLFDDILKEAEE